MVGPARKREAVTHVSAALNASERRACRSLGQARSTQRYETKVKDRDKSLIRAMRRIALREPRAGYRMVARYLRKEGWEVNIKRVHRLWKQEGLRVPTQVRKRRRLGKSANGTQRRSAERINHVWSYDFLNVELFGSVLEAKVLGAEHRQKYNQVRPHSSLGDQTPAEFAARCPAPFRPPVYTPQDSETKPKPKTKN